MRSRARSGSDSTNDAIVGEAVVDEVRRDLRAQRPQLGLLGHLGGRLELGPLQRLADPSGGLARRAARHLAVDDQHAREPVVHVHRQGDEAAVSGAGVALAHPLHQLVGLRCGDARPDGRAVEPGEPDRVDVEQRAQPARRRRGPGTCHAAAQVVLDAAARGQRRHGVGSLASAAPPRERRADDGHDR